MVMIWRKWLPRTISGFTRENDGVQMAFQNDTPLMNSKRLPYEQTLPGYDDDY